MATDDDGATGHTVAQVSGAIISLLSCLFVIISYQLFLPLKSHPNGLIFWMSVFSLGFNVIYLAGVGAEDELGCDKTGPLSQVRAPYHWPLPSRDDICTLPLLAYLASLFPTQLFAHHTALQFFLLGTELYLLCLAADLHVKTMNPFQTDFLQILSYHIFVWTVSSISAVILWYSGKSGLSALGFCWIKNELASDFSGWSYVLLVFPIATIYIVVAIIFFFVQQRLKKGLPESFAARQHVLSLLKVQSPPYGKEMLYIKAFTLYWTFLGGVYTLLMFLPYCGPCNTMLQFLTGAKGLVNAALWAKANKIRRAYEAWRRNDWDRVLENDSINWALRHEIIYYTTIGITRSVTLVEEEIKTGRGVLRQQSRRHTLSPGTDTFNKVEFTDQRPQEFATVRELFGIKSTIFLESFKGKASEKYSEGKSGAFLYFTGDNRFIVKTCKKDELDFLLEILPNYIDHLKNNPDTLIARILGAYELTMYNKVVRFICLQTVFDTPLRIHERFDLKGSWVGRIDRSNEPGRKAICNYCGAKFVIGMSKAPCPNQAYGLRHASESVGKDMNWGGRRLDVETSVANKILMQLHTDSLFLAEINSLDYSLLVGIHYRAFEAPPEAGEEILSSSSPPVAGVSNTPTFMRSDRSPSLPGASPMQQSPPGSALRHRANPRSTSSCPSLSLNPPTLRSSSCDNHTLSSTGLRPILIPSSRGGETGGVSVASPSDTASWRSGQQTAGRPMFFRRSKGGIRANVVRGPGTYFIGIIDILTRWSWRKRLEHCLRVYILGQSANGISCIRPDLYAKRFQTNVVEELVLNGKERVTGHRRNTQTATTLRRRSRAGTRSSASSPDGGAFALPAAICEQGPEGGEEYDANILSSDLLTQEVWTITSPDREPFPFVAWTPEKNPC